MKAVKPSVVFFSQKVPIVELSEIHGLWRAKLNAAYAEEALVNGDVPPYAWLACVYDLGKHAHASRVRGIDRFIGESSSLDQWMVLGR